jgi:HK97 family phage prohead protease
MTLYKNTGFDEIVKEKSTVKQRRVFIGNPGAMEISADECKALIKRMPSKLEYLSGYESRLVRYAITSETCDRYGDIVRASGCNLTNYLQNPVIQFAHDYSELPVGNAIKIVKNKQNKTVDAVALYFDDRVDSSGRSDTIFRFVKANAMRAVSIGFMPIKYQVPKTTEDREKLGLGEYGVEFIEWDLMEFSACPVPANPEALTNGFKDEYRKAIHDTIKAGQFEKKHVDVLRSFPLVDESVVDEFIKALDPLKSVVVDGKTKDAIGNDITDKSDDNDNNPDGEKPVPEPTNVYNINIDWTEIREMKKDLMEYIDKKIGEISEQVKSLSDRTADSDKTDLSIYDIKNALDV